MYPVFFPQFFSSSQLTWQHFPFGVLVPQLQILVQEVAQQKMRLTAGPTYTSPTKGGGGSGGGGGAAAALTALKAGDEDVTMGTDSLTSPEGSVPGSEGRVKRKKTQKEKDDFLNARMGLKIENTKGVVVTKTIARDFFGREIKAEQTKMGEEAEEELEVQVEKKESTAPSSAEVAAPKAKKFKRAGPIFVFRYQEGYSNAVRRTVRLEDLL